MSSPAAERMRRLRETRKAAGVCWKCGKSKPVRGKSCCEPCLDAHRKRLSRQLKAAKSDGRCAKCLVDPVSNGRSVCDGCLETLRLRYQGRKMAGLCGVCGIENDSDSPTCARCKKANRIRTRRLYRRKRYAKNHACHECGGWKFDVHALLCKPCDGLNRGPLPVLRAMAINGWSTAHDIAKDTGLSVRAVYRAIAKANRDGGEVAIRYSGAVRGSVAHYQLVKPPTWYRP